MTRDTRRKLNTFFRYFVLIAVGLVMIYPLIWMVGATFKTNNEIFSGIGFIPKNPTLSGYQNAMKSYGGDIDIVKAMINMFTGCLWICKIPVQRERGIVRDFNVNPVPSSGCIECSAVHHV